MSDGVKSLTPTGKQRGGVTGKGFQPGQSGNPGGRAKGLAEAVREVVDPRKWVQQLVLIAYGASADQRKELGQTATVKDREKALEMLADRGWGKPTQSLEVEHSGGLNIGWDTGDPEA